ncbi:hypothetical protein N7532_006497 [Penicillium argentinense]|uniref:RRM domain-containing protein n=1 Tax=Penicillium argentinense TaxID=1131581 RepID=A0A9W9KBD2_9EURO|nr:uncharacterized protein N7532_006497 [Penicillium argentinense]KAJ5099496.1 hypothetical protein N7532_006497 [Penicillium argentinense]
MSGSSNQSTRTSPGSFGTTQRTESVSSGSSPTQIPSKATATTQHAMSTDVYSPSTVAPSSLAPTFTYPFSPLSSPHDGAMRLGSAPDNNLQGLNGFGRTSSGSGAILMRKLPRNTSKEALRSMLLFAKDFVDADFVNSDLPEDDGFLSAIARFNTLPAAEEARALLDGKPNSKNDATMVVEMYPGALGTNLSNARRNTIDHTNARGVLGGVPSNGPLSRQSSRFNGTFQSLERLSANAINPSVQGGHLGQGHSPGELQAIGEFRTPASANASDTGSRLHNLFSPQSPIGNGVGDLPRVTGKSMIDEDPDEETNEMLKDPIGYAENGHSASVSAPRRSTNPQLPTSRFANLSLSAMSSPPLPNYASADPRQQRMSVSGPQTQYQNSVGHAHGHGFPYGSQHTPRHSLPAANPNDLNPPCNTLYVGNLPPDTSEEELKALFSKQRGYKRLCFRNKQNGPMCFVEFDEVAMASKALNELYGYKLSNSVKTGIRLSFSKNPLGVRSGQPGSMNPAGPLSGPAVHPWTRRPPGLQMPMPGRHGGGNAMHGQGHPHAVTNNPSAYHNPNTGPGIRTNGGNSMMMSPPPPPSAGNAPNAAAQNMNGFNSFYPDYMMGR